MVIHIPKVETVTNSDIRNNPIKLVNYNVLGNKCFI